MSRPAIAALLSGLACPGAGQIYNRQYAKGGILVALTLIILGALFYVTWCGMAEVMGSIPPEKAMEDAFGLARRIMEGDKEFYDGATDMFTVIWLYGVVDAYVFGSRIQDKREGPTHGSAPT